MGRRWFFLRLRPVWGPVIELVDLRCRPEVNTMEALAESDPCKHCPLRRKPYGPSRQTSPASESVVNQGRIVELRGRGGAGSNLRRRSVWRCQGAATRVRPAGGATTTCSTTWQNGSQAQHTYQGMRAKQGRCKRLYLDPPCGKWSSCGRSCCEYCPEPTWLAWRLHQW